MVAWGKWLQEALARRHKLFALLHAASSLPAVAEIVCRFWRHFHGLEGFAGTAADGGGPAVPCGAGGEGNKFAEALQEATSALKLQLETALLMEEVLRPKKP